VHLLCLDNAGNDEVGAETAEKKVCNYIPLYVIANTHLLYICDNVLSVI